MSHSQSQYSVAKLYQSVIEDVIAGVRDSFLDEGVDEQVLQELRQLWESKLSTTKSVDINHTGPESSSSSSARNNGNASQNPKQNMVAQGGAHNTSMPTSVSPLEMANVSGLVPIQISMPRQPNDTTGIQKTITIQVPASCIHSNKLQEVLSVQAIQATLALPSDLAAQSLQKLVNQALGFDVNGANAVGSSMAKPSVITTSQQQQLLQNQPKQQIRNLHLDGAAGGDSSDDEEDEEEEEDDLDDDVDDREDQGEEEQEEEGQDEEPLNSGDDVSDAEDANDKLYEIDNVVVCQYDKITRTRNKWKFHLKDGIMNLNGKDYVFQKASGDAEW